MKPPTPKGEFQVVVLGEFFLDIECGDLNGVLGIYFFTNDKTMEDQGKKSKMHQGATHLLYQNARELRENMTLAERILWEELRIKKLDGFKFRRQHPVGIHILDFYCHSKKTRN